MNDREALAWRRLEEMGAAQVGLGGLEGLDLRPIRTRLRSETTFASFLREFFEVAGRSGTVRRHVDRRGSPVFVVRDFDVPKPKPAKRDGDPHPYWPEWVRDRDGWVPA